MAPGEETEQQTFDEQLEAAVEFVVEPIQCMLQAGEIQPHVIVFEVGKVAGELKAAFAAAGGYDPEELLRDIAEIVRRSDCDDHEALAEAMLRVRAAYPRGA